MVFLLTVEVFFLEILTWWSNPSNLNDSFNFWNTDYWELNSQGQFCASKNMQESDAVAQSCSKEKKSIRKGLLLKFSVKFPEKYLRRSSILAKLHALSQLTETPINCCFYSINQAISQNLQICFWLGNSWVTSIIETVSNFSTLCCNFLVISWSLNF